MKHLIILVTLGLTLSTQAQTTLQSIEELKQQLFGTNDKVYTPEIKVTSDMFAAAIKGEYEYLDKLFDDHGAFDGESYHWIGYNGETELHFHIYDTSILLMCYGPIDIDLNALPPQITISKASTFMAIEYIL